jgi:TnpA family transposase
VPRRSILSATERESLLALPDAKDELIRHYTFNESDLSVIRQRRGPANRLGFAVQLCYLRFPGIFLGADVSTIRYLDGKSSVFGQKS